MAELLAKKLFSIIIIVLCMIIIIIWHLIQIIDTAISTPSTRKSIKKPGLLYNGIAPPASNLSLTAGSKAEIGHQSASSLEEPFHKSNTFHRSRQLSGETLNDTYEAMRENQTDRGSQAEFTTHLTHYSTHENFRYIRSVRLKPTHAIRTVARKHLKDACLLCFFQPLKSTSSMQSSTNDVESEDNLRVAQNLSTGIYVPDQEGNGLFHVFPFINHDYEDIIEDQGSSNRTITADLDTSESEGIVAQGLFSNDDIATEFTSTHARIADKEEISCDYLESQSLPGHESSIKDRAYEDDTTYPSDPPTTKIFTTLPPTSPTETALSPTLQSLNPKALDISFSPTHSVEFISGSRSSRSPSPSELERHYDEDTPSKRVRRASPTANDEMELFASPAGVASKFREDSGSEDAVFFEPPELSKTQKRREERKRAKALKKAMVEAEARAGESSNGEDE